jgi:hypothetical protein
MNQVEQGFSIRQRKRLAMAAFADKAELAKRLHASIKEWVVLIRHSCGLLAGRDRIH